MTAKEDKKESELTAAEASAEHRGSKFLTHEDVRLIVITVAATVAANLLTVMVVGIAIVVVRHNKVTTDNLVVSSLFFACITPLSIFAVKKKFGLEGRNDTDTGWLFLTLGILGLFTCILIWVGLAAGIHLVRIAPCSARRPPASLLRPT
jgi:hypothetical protein